MEENKITQMGVRVKTKKEAKRYFSSVFFGAKIHEQDIIETLLEFAKKNNNVETLRKIHNEITINQK